MLGETWPPGRTEGEGQAGDALCDAARATSVQWERLDEVFSYYSTIRLIGVRLRFVELR